ncbi:hypothetical protein J3Q64DRAFT_1853231 [Phycomyces blakesleeanus]|uniref:UspA domain-containing protein n=2 Tax=Phycomyces blakesleeanus TaxID=4837 RepID=A0A167JNZ1_PHYB8|nr:hypothetical protein PHYBLDRAFT_183863 [Phycomyces blakesleeanus NRRL 1555(-)]OAD66406.1 hypothetical protein PHYBLDRAFT_183863 [Phycomyces blakesleeanus NRRL 1555(-)]|eukprot:XP_018284446.1 hypothetical protein PHYBLDRAFT_183863 [Phycomyces blakesleeanus NRRL 1555(-)]
MSSSRQIVLSIDPLSEEADYTVQWVAENFLRKTDNIYIFMVLVVEDDNDVSDELEAVVFDDGTLSDIQKETAAQNSLAMANIVKRLNAKGFNNVSYRIYKAMASKACDTLVQYIDSQKTDCLVMGSRSLSGWKRFFMGSFSDYVQSQAKCPVLIVK